jgi:hypothetical protein
MSDEFVKLLRNPAFAADATDRKVMNEAADRIEHLLAMAVLDGDEIALWREIVSFWRERLKQSKAQEAALNLKLAKAVDALDEALYLLRPDEEDMLRKAGVYRIVTTLAELKGQNDE